MYLHNGCGYFTLLCNGGAGLGIASQPITWDDSTSTTGSEKEKKDQPSSHSPTPPPQRRLAKSFSVAPSAVTKGNGSFHFFSTIIFFALFSFSSLLCLNS